MPTVFAAQCNVFQCLKSCVCCRTLHVGSGTMGRKGVETKGNSVNVAAFLASAAVLGLVLLIAALSVDFGTWGIFFFFDAATMDGTCWRGVSEFLSFRVMTCRLKGSSVHELRQMRLFEHHLRLRGR